MTVNDMLNSYLLMMFYGEIDPYLIILEVVSNKFRNHETFTCQNEPKRKIWQWNASRSTDMDSLTMVPVNKKKTYDKATEE